MRIHALATLAAAALALATAAPLVSAQPATDTPPAPKKPVRKPPSDLESEAKRPRDGQVVPSNAAPPAPAPSAAPPPPAPPQPETQPQPAPSAQPPPKQPAAPATQPRPQPAPASHSTPVEPPAQPPKASPENEPRFVAVDHVQVTFAAVQGDTAQVEWRIVDSGTGKPGKWTPVSLNETIDDRIEIRSGLGVGLTLRLADQAVVEVSRLARLRLERKIRSDGTSQLGILLSRGELRITGAQNDDMGLSKSPVYVRTPDGSYPIRTHTSIAYDAFNGTTTQDLGAH